MAHVGGFDIIVVGAGPAGTSTWLHLQKYAPALAGRTMVVDAVSFPRAKLCGGAVGAWSDAVLDHLAVDLDIPSVRIADVGFRYRGESWIYHSPTPFRMVERADFDAALVKAAVQRGLVFREAEPVTDVKRQDGGVLVSTRRRTYRVKAIVGADGAFSAVRRAVVSSWRARLAPTIQITSPVDPQFDFELDQFQLGMDFSPIDEGLQGYVWHFPWRSTEGAFINHGIGDFRIFPGRPRARMKKLFSRELRKRRIDIGPDAWSSHPIHRFSREAPIAQPNALLVGDAAGIEPAFGGGIHLALSYGEIAARALIAAFRRNDFSFRDYQWRIESHYMGKHMQACTRLAARLYGGRENPLALVRQFFTGRLNRPDLLSLLLRPRRV